MLSRYIGETTIRSLYLVGSSRRSPTLRKKGLAASLSSAMKYGLLGSFFSGTVTLPLLKRDFPTGTLGPDVKATPARPIDSSGTPTNHACKNVNNTPKIKLAQETILTSVLALVLIGHSNRRLVKQRSSLVQLYHAISRLNERIVHSIPELDYSS